MKLLSAAQSLVAPIRRAAHLGQRVRQLLLDHPLMGQVWQRCVQLHVLDRAAALAAYSMLAAVPTLLAAFSVIGYLLGAVDKAGNVTGLDLELQSSTLSQLTTWMRQSLPGITWNPAEFAAALVRHRTTHGLVGFVLAIFLGLTVFGSIDDLVRDLFGKPRRSTIRAAGYMAGLVSIMVVFALLINLLGPLVELGAYVAKTSVRTVSLGYLDGVALLVMVSQAVPVSLVFYLLVRWSVGRVGKRRLSLTALAFGLLWMVGQQVFTLYVKSVVHMDAVYGALTGVVALLLWMFYANIAFMLTVAFVAVLEGNANKAALALKNPLAASAIPPGPDQSPAGQGDQPPAPSEAPPAAPAASPAADPAPADPPSAHEVPTPRAP